LAIQAQRRPRTSSIRPIARVLAAVVHIHISAKRWNWTRPMVVSSPAKVNLPLSQ
jgi:hypothetical protein